MSSIKPGLTIAQTGEGVLVIQLGRYLCEQGPPLSHQYDIAD